MKVVLDEPLKKAWQGSCLDSLQVIERSSVSLIFTSPPYPGVAQPEDDYATFEEPMDFNASHEFLGNVWKVCFDLLEDLGRLVVNIYDVPTGDPEMGVFPNCAAVTKRCLEAGFIIRETFIWQKGAAYSPPHGSWPYPKGVLSANTFEPCLVFQKPLQFSQRRKDPSDYPEEVRKKSELGSEEHGWLMENIWSIPADREGRKHGHPFTFPVELASRFIRLYSYFGDNIYDPFLGSGTTLEAAAKLGRIGMGTELSDKYCAILEKRFAQQGLF